MTKYYKFKQDKLWRDKIPAFLQAHGSVVHIKQLSDSEYDKALRIKLVEEAQEVAAAQSCTALIEELADVYEVIDALCMLHQINKEEVVANQNKKCTEKGGFAERAFVTVAEHPEGSVGEKYCRADPLKYPEVL